MAHRQTNGGMLVGNKQMLWFIDQSNDSWTRGNRKEGRVSTFDVMKFGFSSY